MIMPIETEIDIAIKQFLHGLGKQNKVDATKGFHAIGEWGSQGKPFPPGPFGLEPEEWERCLKVLGFGFGMMQGGGGAIGGLVVKECTQEEAEEFLKKMTGEDIDLDDPEFS